MALSAATKEGRIPYMDSLQYTYFGLIDYYKNWIRIDEN